MTNTAAAIEYLAKYDLATQDRTTLGHCRDWFGEALADSTHALALLTSACPDDPICDEIRGEVEILSAGLRTTETLLAA
jgi:hypothetical protein